MSSGPPRTFLPIPATPCFVAALWIAALQPFGPARACDEPVFRWALSHWGAWDAEECFQVTLFHRGELGAAARAELEALEARAWPKEGSANAAVRAVDLTSDLDERTKALWEAQREAATAAQPEVGAETPAESAAEGETGSEAGTESDPELPWAVVMFPPPARIPVSAWSGPLASGLAKEITDSPARQRIAKRILEGDAAVWLLLECGDAEKDAAARKLLEEHLEKLEQAFELPRPIEEEWGYWEIAGRPGPEGTGDGAGSESAAVEEEGLHPSFSLERVARTDESERFLVRMLLRTEPDLEVVSRTEPVAFPVFGRGRVLYALVGKGITEENVEEACGYIVGRCSCEFKWMNPGVDLLMTANWDAVPATPSIGAPQLLDLVSPPTREEKAEVEEARAVPAIAPGEKDDSGDRDGGDGASGSASQEARPEAGRTALLRNVGIAVGALVLVLGASALALRRRLGRL